MMVHVHHSSKEKMAITQAELARMAGVHRNTVVRVFRDPDCVAPDTRDRILELANQLGYRPSASARAMRDGKYGAVGLLTSPIGSANVSFGMVSSMINHLSQKDVHLTIGRLPEEDIADREKLPRLLREWAVDRLVIGHAYYITDAVLELAATFRPPPIWLNAKLATNALYIDDYAAARRAVARLAEAGHRRILFLGPKLRTDQPQHYSVGDRYRGYRDAMEEWGAEPVFCFPSDSGETRAPLKEKLSGPNRPTAVVTVIGGGIVELASAWELGLSVPRDLSIVAFRDPLIHSTTMDHETLGIRLSSMELPVFEIGWKAAEWALDEIASVPSIAMKAREKEGDTIAPPPS